MGFAKDGYPRGHIYSSDMEIGQEGEKGIVYIDGSHYYIVLFPEYEFSDTSTNSPRIN